MFSQVSISFDELKPLLAAEISRTLKEPISAGDILCVDVKRDEDTTAVTGLLVDFEVPRPLE